MILLYTNAYFLHICCESFCGGLPEAFPSISIVSLSKNYTIYGWLLSPLQLLLHNEADFVSFAPFENVQSSIW